MKIFLTDRFEIGYRKKRLLLAYGNNSGWSAATFWYTFRHGSAIHTCFYVPQVHSHPQFASDCAFLYLGNALKEMTGKADCKTPRKSFQKFSTAKQFFVSSSALVLWPSYPIFCRRNLLNINSRLSGNHPAKKVLLSWRISWLDFSIPLPSPKQ